MTSHRRTVTNLREDNDFADVTLVSEDCSLVEAHKVNLAASSPAGVKKNMNINSEIVEIEDDEDKIEVDEDKIEDKDQEMATDITQSSIHPSEQELSGIPFGRPPGPPISKNKYEEIILQLKMTKRRKKLTQKLTRCQKLKKSKVHCEQCGKEFKIEHTLRRHIVTKHNEVKYDCTKCDVSVSQKSHLNRHMKSKHEDIKHFCQKCNSEFSRKDHLKRHEDVSHGEVKQKCDVCGNNFNYRSSLKEHSLIHAGEKPHKCVKCTKSFTQKYHLVYHIESYHREKH